MHTIESRVPCNSNLYEWLCLHGLPLERLVQPSRRYERAYLAWETVRQVRNPYFNLGTGFEGYYVGLYQSPEAMLEQLLTIGHGMLASNERLYRHEYAFKAKLMKTLQGELNDPYAISVWSSLLGATLGRLRCHIYYNYQIYCFQNETYWAVNRLPFINYRICEHHVEQHYILPVFKNGGIAKMSFSLSALNPSDCDAGLVISTIGRFGHPLVRAYLREMNMY
jgi:hypothetical protein